MNGELDGAISAIRLLVGVILLLTASPLLHADDGPLMTKEEYLDQMKMRAPYMNSQQLLHAYCLGHLRFEDIPVREHERDLVTKKSLGISCVGAGYWGDLSDGENMP